MSEKRYRDSWGGPNSPTWTLQQLIEEKLDGDDYGVGQLEANQAKTNNASTTLSKLITRLHEKNLLSHEDVENIIGMSFTEITENPNG